MGVVEKHAKKLLEIIENVWTHKPVLKFERPEILLGESTLPAQPHHGVEP
jgi:hypothetical protein